MNKRFNKKLLAFTLAEVLVVIGIIGIIADMTIPTIQRNTQKQTQIIGVKKMYTDMSQATRLMFANEGVSDLQSSSLGGDDWNLAGTFLKKYFKVIRDCGTTYPSPCMASRYKNIKRNILNDQYKGYCVVTAGGVSICMTPSGSQPSMVVFDTNGVKPPNIAGRDLFSFNIYDNGTIDEIGPRAENKQQARQELFYWKCDSGGNGANYAAGCFAKVLNDGWVMDY